RSLTPVTCVSYILSLRHTVRLFFPPLIRSTAHFKHSFLSFSLIPLSRLHLSLSLSSFLSVSPSLSLPLPPLFLFSLSLSLSLSSPSVFSSMFHCQKSSALFIGQET